MRENVSMECRLNNNCPYAPKHHGRVDSIAAETSVKFQSDMITETPNLADSRHNEAY